MAAVLIIVMSILEGGGINSCDFLSSGEVSLIVNRKSTIFGSNQS